MHTTCKLIFKIVTLIALALLLFARVFAQSDFLISTEPAPSTFIQDDPKLFILPDGAYIIAWEDYRDGAKGYYAQLFQADGTPVGTNFRVLSNEAFTMAPDGTLCAVGHDYKYSRFDLYQGFVQIYQNNSPVDAARVFEEHISPMCATEFWGIGTELNTRTDITGEYDFLCGTNFGGWVNLVRFSNTGDTIYRLYDHHGDLFITPSSFSIAALPGGWYSFTWFHAYNYYNPHDDRKQGVYGLFFNPQDSLIADRQYFIADSLIWGYYSYPSMKLIALSDTTYQLWFFEKDSLNFLTLNKYGEALQPLGSIGWQHPVDERQYNQPQSPENFSYSYAPSSNTHIILLSMSYQRKVSGTWLTSWRHILQDFDATGQPLAEALIDSGEVRDFGPNFLRGENHQFQSAHTVGTDIYLIQFDQFRPGDMVRVNDDDHGANQQDPIVTAGPEGLYMVTWSDETCKKGRLVNRGGVFAGDELLLWGQEGDFFPDGSYMNLWKRTRNDSTFCGFTLYDPLSRQVVRQDTIYTRPTYYVNDFRGLVVSDSSFLVLLRPSQDSRLLVVLRDGIIVKESAVTAGELGLTLALHREDGNSFWLEGRDGIQLYSYGLTAMSRVLPLERSHRQLINLGAGRFVILDVTGTVESYVWSVIDTSDQVIAQDIIAPYNDISDVSLFTIDHDYFLATWTESDDVWVRAYSVSGRPVPLAFVIHQAAGVLQRSGSAATGEDEVFFAWQDNRTPGNGYDIYGTVLPLSTITAVRDEINYAGPREYVLYPNYPNPANDLTTIPFVVPQTSYVSLKIYNIRGRNVRTLFDGKKESGHHAVTWDGKDDSGNNMPTGIYLCRLTTPHSEHSTKIALIR